MKAQDNVQVQLMREYLELALAALDAGDVPAGATLTRIAYSFEQDIPSNLKYEVQACDAEVIAEIFPGVNFQTA